MRKERAKGLGENQGRRASQENGENQMNGEERELHWEIKPEEVDTPEGIFKLALAKDAWDKIINQLTPEQRVILKRLVNVASAPEVKCLEIESDYEDGEDSKLIGLKVIIHILMRQKDAQ